MRPVMFVCPLLRLFPPFLMAFPLILCICMGRSYHVRRVDGSCAKQLTVESYTVVMLLTFVVIIISIPSPLTPSFQA